ncbi:MAG TPA: lanthionine synthetase LanC family protein [Thermoanaerobaculia bacterium]|nr:lanthionine synthetase LanC family protein [Thermoanaerobaculia bacterium]
MTREELIAEAERIAAALVLPSSGSLYGGSAGVALFLLELARTTGRAAYLDAATRALDGADAPGSGFYTGRLGIAWTMLQFPGDRREAALALARDALEARRSHTADLLGGVAGTLLGVLHLHAATGEPALIEMAAALVEELIGRARPARAGLYWDRGPDQNRGLCGLSHGAAGIGWVFAELAHATGNDAFAGIAREAFAYERAHFDAARGNWIDYRCMTSRAEDVQRLEEQYLRGDLSAFSAGGDMNAWCHGAAGIGLSRMRALELLGDAVLADELQAAIRRVATDLRHTAYSTATLCHGALGNAALLHAAGVHEELVRHVAATAIGRARARGYVSGHPSRQPDDGLMMGTSGVGWFLLQLANGTRRDPLLLPVLGTPSMRGETRGILDATLEELLPRGSARDRIRWQVAERASPALLAIRKIVHGRHADALFATVPLRLSADAVIVDGVLVFATPEGASEVGLAPLTSLILAAFREACRVDEAVERVTREVDGGPAELADIVREQIRRAFLASILVPAA